MFLSDNGTESKIAPLEAFLKVRNVHLTFTLRYYPQANPVEHVNRTVKTMVMSYAEENHRSWDEKLNELAFAYNTARHSSTKRSPAMLIYGRQPDQRKTLRPEGDRLAEEQEQQEALDNLASRMDKLGRRPTRRRSKQDKPITTTLITNKVLSSAAEGISTGTQNLFSFAAIKL